MATHKKRSLSDIKVANIEKENDGISYEKIVPAISNFLTKKDDGAGKAVRGVEFLVDPENCKPWKFHNRDNAWLNPEKCADLISSIRKNEQQLPIIARKIENDPDGKTWEIIAGRRRWYSCKYLKKHVRLKAVSSDDRECAIIMNLENKDRADISEFEDSISYRQQFDAGLFDSQNEMSEALGLNKSKLSKMLAAAKINELPLIMGLFPDKTKLKVNPLYKLLALIEKSVTNKDVIFRKAEKLAEKQRVTGKSLPPSVIISELSKALTNSEKASYKKPKTYSVNNNRVISAHYNTDGNLVMEFKNKNISASSVSELEKVVLMAMKEFLPR